MSAEPPPAQSVEKRRPWYRLHVSTILVLFLAAGVLVLIVLPGDMVESRMVCPGGGVLAHQRRFEYGWPGVYPRRTEVHLQPVPQQSRWGIPWLSREAWRFSGGKCELRRAILVYDLVVVVVILAAVGGALEWRRRRHHRVWQFRLAELLLLMLLISGALGWWQYNRACYVRELATLSASVEQVQNDYFVNGHYVAGTRYRGPVWLRRLAGAGNLSVFHRITHVGVGHALLGSEYTPLDDEQFRDDVRRIRRLPHVATLEVYSGLLTDDGFACITELPRLRELYVAAPQVTDSGLEHLRCLDRLEELQLRDVLQIEKGLKYLRDLPKLRRLHVVGTKLDADGLLELAALTQLEYLDLRFTQVQEQQVEDLRKKLPDCDLRWDGW